MRGKIIRIVSNQYTIYTADHQEIEALAMGKVRLQGRILVGDEVEYDVLDGKNCIQKIMERRSELYRPAIANVDQALIVMSAVDPAFSNVLVDRLIFLISYHFIEPVIVISKMDLVGENDELYRYIEDYRSSGYKVILVGKELDLSELKETIKGKVSVLTGQSGVGKSTLLNRLDPNFCLHTQEISKALGRGKHTTRHSQLYEVADGWLADTPGFSSLDFSRIDSLTLIERISDFKTDEACRFNDCHHLNEPDCAIKNGVKNGTISALRYQNYVDIVPQCNIKKEWEL